MSAMGDELRQEIARSPIVCGRCNLRECTCWEEHQTGIMMAPTGKAFVCGMKIAYSRLWDSIDTTEPKAKMNFRKAKLRTIGRTKP